MGMKATEQLKAEHDGIKLMLRILEEICIGLESGQDLNTEHLESIIEFFRIFADRCHHGKEEDLLFPALERAGIPKDGGPIGQMLLEHDEGRRYIRGMADALARHKNGERSSSSEFVVNARNYTNLLTNHIEKENSVLFRIADQLLSPGKQDKLLEEFENLEVNRIGKGKHEEFHRLLDELADVYLKLEG